MAGKQFQSLRLYAPIHKLRQGSLPNLVEANSGRTITYSVEPFEHFDVQPEGVCIPIHNVASAIPVDSGVGAKIAKTVGAMKAAREAKQKAASDAAE